MGILGARQIMETPDLPINCHQGVMDLQSQIKHSQILQDPQVLLIGLVGGPSLMRADSLANRICRNHISILAAITWGTTTI